MGSIPAVTNVTSSQYFLKIFGTGNTVKQCGGNLVYKPVHVSSRERTWVTNLFFFGGGAGVFLPQCSKGCG